jgi:hypothetical protein
MAWSASKIFTTFVQDSLNNTSNNSGALLTDNIRVALYGFTITPDQTVTSTASGYNQTGSLWTSSGLEVTATGWTAGGLTLVTKTSNYTTNVYTFNAGNQAGGASDTVTNAYGVLIYNNSLTTKNGVSYNYFGGPASVTSGTFTVVFNASGIFTLTL